MCAEKILGSLGKLLQLEGADPRVLVMVYKAVTQVVLIFGSDTWLLLVSVDRKLEVTHKGFLR